MKIFIDGFTPDIIDDLKYKISERGHQVIERSKFKAYYDRIDAAIFFFYPYKNVTLINHSEIDMYFNEYEMLLKRLPGRKICLIANTSQNSFATQCHIVVGQWPRIWTKIERWINEIERLSMKRIKNSSPTQATTLSLEQAISIVMEKQNTFNNIRIFAFSSIRVAELLKAYANLRINKATVLLREYTLVDKYCQLSEEEHFNESTALWKQMIDSGIINDLEVLRFDFHPTYGIVIFDNSYAIWDNFYFDFKTEKYSFDKNVLLIDISSEVGRELINNSISSFDNLADNYRDL